MPAARVESVEVVPYSLPFRVPYATARGVLERREMALLRLRTADHEGLGEAVPLSLRGGARLEEVVRQLRETSERLTGLELPADAESPLAPAIATVLELARPRRLAAPTIAALECALFDLAAKAAGVPLWRALGAAQAAPIAVNATLVAAAPRDVARDAADWAAAGFTTFKLKLGAGLGDVETAAAVRAELGDGPRLRADANEAWRPREATATLERLAKHDLELCEQPVAGLRAMARVARGSAVPLAADESVASEADAHRARRARACSYVTAKLAKVGGLGAAAAISRVLPTYLSSALDGPVGIAAAAHCALALDDPGLAHGLATQRLFATSVTARECELRGGTLHVAPGPGLGVELDEQALARRRL